MYLSERPRTAEPSEQTAPATPTAPPAAGGRRRRERVATTVVLLGLVSLFTDVSSESVSAILPVYLTTVLGLSPLAYGVIDGLYQGVSALVRILAGWLADRFDRPKWVAFVGYGLSAVTKVALIPLHGFAALTTVITLDRLGKGIRTAPRDAIIAASSPPERLGRAFGVHRTLDTVGAAVGPLLAFAILLWVPGDYTSVFVASFAAALVGLLLLGLLVPDLRPRRWAAARAARANGAAPPSTRPTTAPVVEPARPVRPSLRALTGRGLGRLVVVTALLSVLAVSDGFLYLSLQQRDDFAATYFPLLFVGTNIAYVALAVPLGRLSDRLGRARVLVGGHVLLAAAYLCAAGPVGGLAMTLLTLALLGTFYAATDGVLAALTASLVPTSVRSVAIATTQTVTAVGRFASSLVFGVLWSWVGRGPAVLGFAVALAAAVPVAWWLLRGLRPAPQATA